MLNAEFQRLPETFLVMYREQILAWAWNLERHGPRLTLDLVRPVGESVLHVGSLQPTVTLECQVWGQPGDIRFLIKPASDMDAEIVVRHCEELPRLRMMANDDVVAPKPKKQVDAVFDDIPEAFVQEYLPELSSWGADFGRRGPTATIVLRDIPTMPVLLDDHGQRPMIGVHLSAKVDRARRGDNFMRLIISPETEDDRRKIARHCRDMAKYGRPVPPVGRPKARPSIEVGGLN